MQPVMRNKRFWICDSVPKTFEDIDGTKELYDAEGYYDARTSTYKPSGHLIDSFTRPAAKKDVADTLAMALEYEFKKNRKPQRYCFYKPYRPKPLPEPLTEQRKDALRVKEYQHSPTDENWWDKTLNDFGF